MSGNNPDSTDNPEPAERYRIMARIGVVSSIMLFAVVMFFMVRLFPIYVDHNFVTSVARSMLEYNNVASMSQSQILQDLESSLRLNNIRNFDIKHVLVRREGNYTVIEIRYEKRVKLIGNIELLVKFDEVLQ